MESGYGSRLSGDVDQFSRKSISTPSIAMTSAFVAALIVIVLPCPASSSIFYQKSPLARFASQSPPGKLQVHSAPFVITVDGLCKSDQYLSSLR